MPRLLEVADLCSSTVADTANRLLKRTDSEGSSSVAEEKSSAVPFFRSGHMSAICARPSKGKGRKSEGGNRRCLSSCAPARRQRSSVRFSSDTPPLGKGVKIIGWKPQVSTLLCARAASAQFRSLLKRHSPVRERGENQRVETAGVYPLARRRGCGEPPRQRLAPILYAQEAAKPQFTSCTDRNRVLK